MGVVNFLDKTIEDQILHNLALSDGKERTYFDVMRGVDMRSVTLANKVLERLLADGVLRRRKKQFFLAGNRPMTVEMYQSNVPVLKDRVVPK